MLERKKRLHDQQIREIQKQKELLEWYMLFFSYISSDHNVEEVYKRVRDRADYTLSRQPAEGMGYVLMNGRVVLEGGKPNAVFPGRGLRRSR